MKSKILLGVLLLSTLVLHAQQMDLAGRWRFAVDRDDIGTFYKWYGQTLTDAVTLPGSMMTNNKGDEVDLRTPWVGDIIDRAFFTDDAYAPYRRADNFKVPFWLQPNRYYAGVAWYQRDVDIPADWDGRIIGLYLERCHWESRVWVDNRPAGMQNGLGAPHEYDLTALLTPGRHTLSIRVDNRVGDIQPGVNSHSISDHTQGNWNGIAGAIRLEARPKLHFDDVRAYPSLPLRRLTLRMNVRNADTRPHDVELAFTLLGKPTVERHTLQPGDNRLECTVPLPASVQAWDEFHPNLYTLEYALSSDGTQRDSRRLTFGCRTWSVADGVLQLNGRPAFMRGTLHCASFPLTGYPSTDKEEWLRELRACRAHGINHVRFHSWCPPEAAFEAADELGMYLQVECSTWPNQGSTIGDGRPLDDYVKAEAERIVRAFGNHPSFCMLAAGNEPAGRRHKEYLTDFVDYWKQDGRFLCTSSAGWPNLPVSDFLSDSAPRIQQWGAGLKSIINAEPPSTTYDWRDYTSQFTQPFISHEIGQWCVYPDFKEIKKYTGVYRARNFEIFQETLAEAGLSAMADSFLIASGKLQTLCYKADIEAALRTPSFGGFQLLGLNDFPGQGTALVGTLDAFWQEKGYVSPAEYSRFCNSVVPLARIPKLVMDNNETFTAQIEVANYREPMRRTAATWRVVDASGRVLRKGKLPAAAIPIGNCIRLGDVSFGLTDISRAVQLRFEVTVGEYSNDWDFWVYPARKEQTAGTAPLLTDRLDAAALARLQAGGTVLLSLRKGTLPARLGGDVAIGFSSIFWNTSWTAKQAPHTLGIVCRPEHPALAQFPTAWYSNYQWWDAMSHSGAINIGRISRDIRPVVRVIDDWFTNRSLALLFEVKVGAGRLMVSGIDFHDDMAGRPAARQLLHSVQSYMQSDAFRPATEVPTRLLTALTEQ